MYIADREKNTQYGGWHPLRFRSKNGQKAVTMRFRAVQGTPEPLQQMEMKFWDEKGEEMNQEEGMKMMGEIEIEW